MNPKEERQTQEKSIEDSIRQIEEDLHLSQLASIQGWKNDTYSFEKIDCAKFIPTLTPSFDGLMALESPQGVYSSPSQLSFPSPLSRARRRTGQRPQHITL